MKLRFAPNTPNCRIDASTFSYSWSFFLPGGSPSSTKKKGKGSSKRSRVKKKQEDEEDRTEATHEKNEAEKEPEQSSETQTNNQTTAAPDKQNESQIYFSDEDEDMNVDFNIDIDINDDDDIRKEGSKADDDSEANRQDKTEENETRETQRDNNSSEDTMGQNNEDDDDDVRKEGNEADYDSGANTGVQDKTEEVETMRQNEEANGEDDDDGDEQDGWMGAESGGSSPVRTGRICWRVPVMFQFQRLSSFSFCIIYRRETQQLWGSNEKHESNQDFDPQTEHGEFILCFLSKFNISTWDFLAAIFVLFYVGELADSCPGFTVSSEWESVGQRSAVTGRCRRASIHVHRGNQQTDRHKGETTPCQTE